jgi:signal transduction histidine kinase
VDCRVECERAVELPDENVARHLYRIAQEAVHNAVKHSKGKCIHIELVERDHHVTLTVKDDGRGFSKSVSKPGHLGLHIMEYRAKIIGAMLDIRSAPGKGTIVTCSLNRPRPSHEEKSPR